MCVVVYNPSTDVEWTVTGPFPDHDAAMRWATAEYGINGPWCWYPLAAPR